jgi:hypothetical protein
VRARLSRRLRLRLRLLLAAANTPTLDWGPVRPVAAGAF